ncbi:MAG: dihydroorotase [Thiohalospira sp.]
METTSQRLTLPRPDDWHLHLRDGAILEAVAGHTAATFARAIIMPNLKPPVTTTALATEYRERILAALPAGSDFQPLMTLYLTDNTEPAEIDRAADSGLVFGVKLYPAGATTHSDAGVTDLTALTPTLERMAERGLPLLIHGEVTDPAVDIFDRETVFIERVLIPLRARVPALRIVLEHITTRQAAEWVRAADDDVAATITPQHLLHNRNDLLVGGIRPHRYCLPILKREEHRQAVVDAATSGSPKFFAGTDSAPHPRGAKESACGCAGIYSAPLALPLYAEAFEAAGALDRLGDFVGGFGADFYGLPRNRETVELVRESWTAPAAYPAGEEAIVPLRAGEELAWQVVGPSG